MLGRNWGGADCEFKWILFTGIEDLLLPSVALDSTANPHCLLFTVLSFPQGIEAWSSSLPWLEFEGDFHQLTSPK